MHTPIRTILAAKATGLHGTNPQASVASAVRSMNQHHIGALLVMERNELRGIFTERDVLTRVLDAGMDPVRTRVAEVMTPTPRTIGADATLEQALRRMSHWGHRHLPVVEAGRVMGMIALDDLSRWLVSEQGQEIDELLGYITDHPARPQTLPH